MPVLLDPGQKVISCVNELKHIVLPTFSAVEVSCEPSDTSVPSRMLTGVKELSTNLTPWMGGRWWSQESRNGTWCYKDLKVNSGSRRV